LWRSARWLILVGEGRVLVLERLNRAPRLDLQHLIQVAGLRIGALDAMCVAFALMPRLNTADRLENTRAAYDLLMCENPTQVAALAAQLDRQNRERQQVMAAIAADAEQCAIPR